MSILPNRFLRAMFCSVLCFLLFLPAIAGAASFSRIVAFGDSLSDHGGLQKYIGAYDPVSNPNGALTTWSNGDVWLDYLKKRTNSDLDDRAIAGAMTEGHENSSVQSMINSGALPDLGLSGQVNSYLASNPVIDSTGTLFSIWIGGNDLLEYSRGESKYTSPDSLILGATGVTVQAMENLYEKGGRNFLVLNLPDIGKAPAFSSSSAEMRAVATLMSTMYNQYLWNLVDQFASSHADASVIKFDVFSYINSELTGGEFANTTETYMKYDANGNRTLEHNEPASDYFFWDMIHPMTRAHQRLADAVFSSSGATVNRINPVVAVTGYNISSSHQTIQASEPVIVTVNASATGSAPVYYEFYYCANYGTSDYSSTQWTKVQDYSTSNSCTYSFPSSGNYIVVARAVTDPSNLPSALPIVGSMISVGGGTSQVNISGYTTTATPDTVTGSPVNISVNASTPDSSAISYKFFYCGNYGSSTYDTSAWNTVQEYSSANSCSYTFSDPGNYIVVTRAVTDPRNEPDALPIVGSIVTVNSPAQ